MIRANFGFDFRGASNSLCTNGLRAVFVSWPPVRMLEAGHFFTSMLI